MKRPFLIFYLLTTILSCDALFLGEEENIVSLEENLGIPQQLEDGLETDSAESVNIDLEEISKWITAQHSKKPDDKIRSILISRKNKLVLEAYFNGWNRERKQDMRSATKSITSALVGIAIDQQILPNEQVKILDYFDEYNSIGNWDDRKSSITVEDFLRMRTGLSCNDWVFSSPGNEEKMYETADWIKFILDLPMVLESGATFSYCTGAPVTLGAVVANASGKSIPEFTKENLFNPLRINDYAWEFMPSGRTDTGGHLHLRSRDMLKLGMLFLNQGNWAGEQLISEEWVQKSTAANGLAGGQEYAYLWWVTSWSLNEQEVTAYFASGNGGQLIFVIPDLESVVVLTGGQYGANWLPSRLNLMQNIILPAFQ